MIKDANHHVNILNIYFVYNQFIINKLYKVIIENTRYNKQPDNILINPRTWMSNISGNKTIDSLSIPGTHDSGSKVFANGWIGTQDHSIKDQLNSGIRFIDIRCCHINNSFYIYHDQFYLNYNFNDIIQIVFNFLKINLNETILMRIKEEYKPNNITRSFEETFQAYYYRYKDLFWKFTSFNPTLDMIRGKIVVIQQFIGLNYGLDWNSFNIQDEYNVILTSDKTKLILNYYIMAGNRKRIINHLSGVGILTPYDVAQITNVFMFNLIYYNNPIYVGIVPIDFPNYNLINAIIKVNF